MLKETGSKRHKAIHKMCQDNDELKALSAEFSAVSSKVFNFHSGKIAYNCKVKNKNVCKRHNCVNIKYILTVMAKQCPLVSVFSKYPN